MKYDSIRRRLDKLETREAGYIDPDLRERLEAGAYYDELTEREKDLYAQHWRTDRETLETVHGAILGGSLHFRIERLVPPRNKAEMEARQAEITAIFDELAAEYNSPEAKAQRKAEYEELQRLGELRRMDCLMGRDMDKEHPLPWAKGANT